MVDVLHPVSPRRPVRLTFLFPLLLLLLLLFPSGYELAVNANPLDENVSPTLAGPVLVNQGRDLLFNIRHPDTNQVYELQWRPDLAAGGHWERLQIGYPAQTNFVVRPPTNTQCFLRLRVPALAAWPTLTIPEDTSALLSFVRVQLPADDRAQLSLSVTNGHLSAGPTDQARVDSSAEGKHLQLSGSASFLRSVLAGIRYQPATNYFGQDQLSLTLVPNAFGSEIDSAAVSILVTPVNDPPVVRPDQFLAREDTTLLVPAPGVLANDEDVEGAPLSALLLEQPAHGSLLLEADGSFAYLPDLNFTGTDQFLYLASDGDAVSPGVEAVIVVLPVPDSPRLRMTNPIDRASLPVTRPVALAVEVIQADSPLVRVDYFSDSTRIAMATVAPFRANWTAPSLGQHVLSALATDVAGQSAGSTPITISIDPDCDDDGLSDVLEMIQGTDPCQGTPADLLWLQIVHGNFQSAAPATQVPEPITLRVSDVTGAGRAEVVVDFSSFAGDPLLAQDPGGRWLTAMSASTDAAGLVHAWATTPTRAGRLGVIHASLHEGGGSEVTLVTTALGPQPGWTFEDVPVAIAAGGAHSLALLRSGTVYAWGANDVGQLGPGIDPEDVPFSAVPLRVAQVSNVVAITAGAWHSVALTAEHTVVGWGAYAENYPATPPAGLSGVIAIAAGESHSLALLEGGTVRGWGDPFTRFLPPANLTQVTAISAGRGFSLALRADGTVVAWGLGPFHEDHGELNVPTGLRGVRAIAAGGEHCLALLTNGTVMAWGANYYGQAAVPAGLSNVVSIAAGFAHSVALRSDGTVVAWGDDRFGQLGRLQDLRNVTAIQAGGDLDRSHNLVLRADAQVWAWGANDSGELGDGTQSSRAVPVLVSELAAPPTVTLSVPFELHTPLR